ncbi:Hypothetical predicted protein [Pelobates cultripes]|uniref:Uncharacterized protein n=1 Tax=Pelobates cultripes TaxID=61616 RepID=A0AAD1VS94_PELCU|nr:Hypothetical predicted protein [Pelobates cultripes]
MPHMVYEASSDKECDVPPSLSVLDEWQVEQSQLDDGVHNSFVKKKFLGEPQQKEEENVAKASEQPNS